MNKSQRDGSKQRQCGENRQDSHDQVHPDILENYEAAFKTWATERTNYPREVVELCLSHLQGDPLERAYQRGDIIEKRRQLMQEWADYCERGEPAAATSNVVAIRA